MKRDFTIKGWHVFAGFAGAFGIIIAVNLVLAFSAVNTFPGLETKNSYVASQSFDDRREAQEALGWTVAATHKAGLLELKITDAQGQPVERPTDRLRRYQADLNLLIDRDHWRLGVGAGQFQHNVNLYYVAPYYPKPSARTDDVAAFGMEADERFTFGLLETTAVELGLPGLAALLWLFVAWALLALRAYLYSDDERARTLALASLGACVGALVFSLFGSPILRGAGGLLALFLALALALNARLRRPAGDRTKEQRKPEAASK